jgi:hypothetical protein
LLSGVPAGLLAPDHPIILPLLQAWSNMWRQAAELTRRLVAMELENQHFRLLTSARQTALAKGVTKALFKSPGLIQPKACCLIS